MIAATELVASPNCELSEEAKRVFVQSKVDALPTVKDAKGLRIDVSLENEITGETVWGDVTSLHPGAESYREQEIKSLVKRQIAARVSDILVVPDPFKLDPSPTLIDRCAAKISKYSRLVQLGKKQAGQGKRGQAPRFAAIAVTDYGEISPMAAELLEWLVQQFRDKCEQEGKRSDGIDPLDRVREFRRALYTRIQFAVAAGCGEMLVRAGQAWG
jgi:hypothetical protein